MKPASFGLLLSVLAGSLLPQVNAAKLGSCKLEPQLFLEPDDIWPYDANHIHAQCKKADKTYGVTQALNLDDCFENDDGVLVAKSWGNFTGTCVNCTLSGTVLSCTCKDKKQVPKDTSIDMRPTITSTAEGRLVCFGTVSFDHVPVAGKM